MATREITTHSFPAQPIPSADGSVTLFFDYLRVEKNLAANTLAAYSSDLAQLSRTLRTVQTILGHCEIDTTQIYSHVTMAGITKNYMDHHSPRMESRAEISWLYDLLAVSRACKQGKESLHPASWIE